MKKSHNPGTVPNVGIESKRIIKTCLVSAVWALSLAHSIPVLAIDQIKKIHFDIPANNLSTALLSYSEATNIQLNYPQTLVAGRKSRTVSGDYTPEQALQTLLGGGDISFQYVDKDAIMLAEATSPKATNNKNEETLPSVTVVGKAADTEQPVSLTTPSIHESQAKLNRVAGGTSVIDAEKMYEGAPLTVNDVFVNAPGIYTADAQAGVTGGSRISIRGSDSNSVLSPIFGIKVLRNGMPFTSANGAADTETVNLFALDHVDVYRGANALEYGSSNLGGAINLITPTGYTADGLRMGMKYGTNDFVSPTFSFGKVFGNGFDVYGSFAYLSTDTTRENNKQEQFYGHGNVGYRWNERQETRLYFDIQNHNFLSSSPLTLAQIKENPQQNANGFAIPSGFPMYRVDLKHSMLLNGGDKFDVGAYYQNKQYAYDYTFGYNHDLWQDTGFNWRHEINSKLLGLGNKVVWGGLTQWQFINDLNYATRPDRTRGALRNAERDRWLNVEAFLEDQLRLTDMFTLIAGVQLNWRNVNYERYEGYVPSAARPTNQADHDFFSANPKLGFTWQATDEAQIYGNVSRSSEPPPLADLASLSPVTKLQTASTVEVGTRGQADFLKWDLAYYHAWVNNEYLIVANPINPTEFTSTNANSTTLHSGVELGLESSLPIDAFVRGDQIRLRGNYTWNNFTFDNDPVLGNNRIAGIPEHVAFVEAVYQHPSGFYIGPNARIVSSNWVDYKNTLAAKPYALLGARIGWDDGKHWKLFIDGRNLTNEHYTATLWTMGDAGGVDQAQFHPGATSTVYGGVEYRF